MMDVFYSRPETVEDALQVVDKWQERGRILAGGTDLLVRMQQGIEDAEAIIDISAIDDWRQITHDGATIEIGALVTFRQIEQDRHGLTESAGVLAMACNHIGSVQIRNRGTIGGNLGNASPAGDAILALYALDAEVCLASVKGERWLAVANFITGPGKTIRQANEIITRVRFQRLSAGEKCFFQKIGQRRAVTISKVSAAGTMMLDGNVVRNCRLALGAVAPSVLRLKGVEKYLEGRRIDDGTVVKAAEMAADACQPIDDIRSTISYRRRMAGVMIRRGLESCLPGSGVNILKG